MRRIWTTSHSTASDSDLQRVRVTAWGWIRTLNHSIGLDFAMDSSPDRIHAHRCCRTVGHHRPLEIRAPDLTGAQPSGDAVTDTWTGWMLAQSGKLRCWPNGWANRRTACICCLLLLRAALRLLLSASAAPAVGAAVPWPWACLGLGGARAHVNVNGRVLWPCRHAGQHLLPAAPHALPPSPTAAPRAHAGDAATAAHNEARARAAVR
jgi:hypothetical protein